MKLYSIVTFIVYLNLAFGAFGICFPFMCPDLPAEVYTSVLPYSDTLNENIDTFISATQNFDWKDGIDFFSNLYNNIQNAINMIGGLITILYTFLLQAISFLPQICVTLFDLPEGFTFILSVPLALMSAIVLFQMITNRSFKYIE